MVAAADYTYQPGGSLPPDAPSYVARQADRDLLAALLSGTYCYVLNARQMGKSSLRVHTVEELFDAGVLCAEVELLGIGSQQITVSQWYGGIIQVLISSLGLQVNRRQWLAEHEDLSPVQRLGMFIEEIVLPQTEQPLVIFFDEIDSVLGLKFSTDEFFGLVRNWYERRSINPAYKRLTVVMLGVATPTDLMQGTHSTPFNIGRAIELRGFTLEEARPLATGLAGIVAMPESVLKEILAWSGGQPFLTQKLCWLVTQADAKADDQMGTQTGTQTGKTENPLRSLVVQRVIQNWESQDEPEHLRTIRNRLLRNARAPLRLLKLYQQVLKRGSLPIDASSEQMELRLTGLVTQQQGQLRVFNQIYQTVFDRKWVAAQIKLRSDRAAHPLSNTLSLWQAIAMGLGATALVLLGRSLGWLQPVELFAFDQLMRVRPAEAADDRFLIITVSEADIQYQDQLGMERTGSLSDQALLQLRGKILPYEPRVIGLDFYHDFPFIPALADQLQADERFVSVCEIGQTLDSTSGTQSSANQSSATQSSVSQSSVSQPFTSIAPPPALPIEQIGFTDFVIDDDYRVRRHLLGMEGTEVCPTTNAFNLLVALKYLETEDIDLEMLSPDRAQLGDRTIAKLPPNAGGYQLETADQLGYQIFLNYRDRNPRQVSLQAVLTGEHDAELEDWIRDRIVLIGLADAKDAPFTPIQTEPMYGVVVHAQMASQLISHALDDRPLIWWLPSWGEILWIAGWTVLSSTALWWSVRRRSSQSVVWICLGVYLGGSAIALYSTSYLLLLIGGWVPLIPPLLSMSLTAGGVIILSRPQSQAALSPLP